jgi:glycosyltransferase involved in cell wall biosynthesis
MNKTTTVLQLIDSLETGGAERIAVNLANALAEKGIGSHLCASRKSGPLENFISPKVEKLFLNRKNLFDIAAIIDLINYTRDNKIDIIHAHYNSFFIATITKLFCKIKIVWHDHDGNSEFLQKRHIWMYRIFSLFWNWVITVNERLAIWNKSKLWINKSKVSYLPNFADLNFTGLTTKLPGVKGNRIVSLANLRPQKDHHNLLKAFSIVLNKKKNIHLILVGMDLNDEYSKDLKNTIRLMNLENNVHILGSRNDIADILANCAIGVLSSVSEGMPVALLEYGLAGLPVVSTNVGQCNDVLESGKAGIIVPIKNSYSLAEALLFIIDHPLESEQMAKNLNIRVNSLYSKDAIISDLLKIYSKLF